jgi:hydrogenase nickel incorporation protein HypA/HybF
MHEMSLCQGLFELMEGQQRKDGFQRVRHVVLEVGVLGHVEPEALRFAFESLAPGSLADGATLELIDVPARAWCMACSRSVDMERRGDPCPHCGGYQLIVEQGEELRLKELEVV